MRVCRHLGRAREIKVDFYPEAAFWILLTETSRPGFPPGLSDLLVQSFKNLLQFLRLAGPAIAAMDDERVHRFWQAGDRDGYIQEAQKFLKLSSGQPATKTVASRWFNVNTILHQTADDLWVHREKQELWWTHSTSAKPEVELIDDPRPHAGTERIFVYYKHCAPWSSRNKKGAPLLWDALHPRAKESLFTEGTLNKLSSDHAAYARYPLLSVARSHFEKTR